MSKKAIGAYVVIFGLLIVGVIFICFNLITSIQDNNETITYENFEDNNSTETVETSTSESDGSAENSTSQDTNDSTTTTTTNTTTTNSTDNGFSSKTSSTP